MSARVALVAAIPYMPYLKFDPKPVFLAKKQGSKRVGTLSMQLDFFFFLSSIQCKLS
jgi:hypothetical protein